MRFGLGLGITAARKTAVDYESILQPSLTAAKGALWNYSAGTVFESVDISDPCEVGDGIQYLTPYLLGSTTPTIWEQASASLRPTWQGEYADFDGGDVLGGINDTLGIFNGASAGVIGVGFRLSTLASDQNLISFSTTGGTTRRLLAQINTAGRLRVLVRRLDADGEADIQSADGVVTTGVDYTAIVTVDWSTGGAGAVRGYINNGADVLNGTLSGSGSVSATDSARARLGANLQSTFAAMTGRMYGGIAASFLPTEDERTAIHNLISA